MKTTFTLKDLVLAGLLIALGLLLPFLTGQIPSLGNALLPMHIPVLIAGFVLGGPLAMVVGLITPLLRSFLLGAPPMFPAAVTMGFELAAYGLFTGLFYQILRKKTWAIYASLILSMILGRVVWGLVRWILVGLAQIPLTWHIFVTEAFVRAVPGIILQIVLIPVLVLALRRARLVE